MSTTTTTTTTIASQNPTKNSEFAHLFELFEKLASRRPRVGATSAVTAKTTAAHKSSGSSSSPAARVMVTEPSAEGEDEEAVDRQRLVTENELGFRLHDGTDWDTDTLSVPAGLYPVFRNLATLVTPRNTNSSRQRNTSSSSSLRSHRAVSSSSSSIDPRSEDIATRAEIESTKFPLGGERQYQFRFKMMIHKLYELDDWHRKVKDVLERSKKEFKSLAEKEQEQDKQKEGQSGSGSGSDLSGDVGSLSRYRLKRPAKMTVMTKKQDKRREDLNREVASPGSGRNRVNFQNAFVQSGMSPTAKRAGRPRSHTVASSGGYRAKESAQRSIYIGAPPPLPSPRDDERAVKKRCVGRRQSMSGVETGERAWFYNAAVASSEINERLSIFDNNAVTGTTSRYGALQQDGRRRAPAHRRVSSVGVGDPIYEERKVHQTESIRKRRATSVALVRRV